MPYRAVKGMSDILPEQAWRWQRLESVFRQVAGLYGFQEIRSPIVEPTDLFVRSIGEQTDVVEKEMYTFVRHDESLALRPEGTAGVARAYVEHALHTKEPISRLYYLGPMFRAERPQRGRYRQFHQAGCEVYGDPGPVVDAEVIALVMDFFGRLGLPPVTLRINSLGGSETRERYRAALLSYFTPVASKLSEHAQARLGANPLRILDSKDPRDQEVAAGAPSVLDLLTESDRAHYQGLLGALDALGLSYSVDPRLVRGLDYYNRTLFEINLPSSELGAQNAVAGGGRYDSMVHELGGPNVPAIGFALGIERVLLSLPDVPQPPSAFCYICPLGAEPIRMALGWARELRARNVRAEIDGRGASLKSQLRRANALGARWAVVLGDAELETGQATVKDLSAHTQRNVPFDALLGELCTASRTLAESETLS